MRSKSSETASPRLVTGGKESVTGSNAATIDPSSAVACTGARGLEYRAYSNASEIEQISRQWDQLLESSPCNRAFASVEWYLASIRTDKYRCWNPLVIAAWHGSDIVGLLPLVLDPDKGSATIPTYCCDYCDIIAREGDLETIAATLNYALVLHGGIQRLVVEMVANDSGLARALSLLAARAGLEFRYYRTEPYRYVLISGSLEEYLASKSQKFRKNLKRARRGLISRALVVKELRPDEFDPEGLPRLCLSMIAARHGEEFKIAERIRSFVSEVFPPLFARGAIRAFAVMNGNRVVALDLCMAGAKSFAVWNGGFLPEAAEWSPGAVLCAFGIEQAIEAGLSEYDFLRGDEDYKSRWANNSRAVGEMEIVLTR